MSLMICPKAMSGECPDKGSWIHCKPHMADKTCKKRKHICGQACIPYIVEQPKEPTGFETFKVAERVHGIEMCQDFVKAQKEGM